MNLAMFSAVGFQTYFAITQEINSTFLGVGPVRLGDQINAKYFSLFM